MILRFKNFYLLIFIFLFLIPSSWAQISQGGQPAGINQSISVPVKTISGLNMTRIIREDLATSETVRFAAPKPVNIDPATDGMWTELPSGDQLWQLELQVASALGLFVIFENFNLPAGAKLFGYHPQTKEKLGAYTERNNKPHGAFMLGMITGSTIRLEYLVPAASVDGRLKAPFKIKQLYVAYNTDHILPSDYDFQTFEGFGDAAACHININCTQGNTWQDHKRGVVRMLRVFEEGIGWCTGSLINNTSRDGTPYILSAHHCIAGATPNLNLWRFDFNYEFAGCSDEGTEPVRYTMLGCKYRSGREQSDFLLLELDDVIPQSYNAYFHGWDRDDSEVPTAMTGIHHPQGDVKKISTSDQPVTVFNNFISWSDSVLTPPNHHFRVFMTEGAFENGSSGSGFFNEDGLIVGQLHGGSPSCDTSTAYYGRFSISWDAGNTPETRLKDWLDPGNTGQVNIGEFEYPSATLSGTVRLPGGTGVQNVRVAATGPSVADTVETDVNGNYSFPNLRNNESVVLSFMRAGSVSNGITISDLITIRSALLSIKPLTPDQQFAADLNESGTVTLGDYIKIRQVFLAIKTEMEFGSWRFFENNINLPMDGNTVRDVLVVKRGDINFNANPSN